MSSGVICVCSPGITPDISPTHIPDEWAYPWCQGNHTNTKSKTQTELLVSIFYLSWQQYNSDTCKLKKQSSLHVSEFSLVFLWTILSIASNVVMLFEM